MIARVVLIIALVFCLEADAKDNWLVTGNGADSCATWTKTQTNRPEIVSSENKYSNLSPGVSWDAYAEIQWAAGFISAYNYYQSETPDISAGTDENGKLAWIDAYCANHPLDNVGQATIALITELSQRAVPLR